MNCIPIFEALQPGQFVLALSAHADDVELGCGGFLRKLALRTDNRCQIRQVVFSGGDDPVRRNEQLVASQAFGLGEPTILSYPDTAFPHHSMEIKRELLEIREQLGTHQIGIVVCPRIDDRHQDHRTVGENAWRVFRDHLILEYEIPKYEGDLVTPNFYVALSETEANEKVERLVDCFPSRTCHHWWSRDTFLALMRLRGVEANAAFAEGMVARKLVI